MCAHVPHSMYIIHTYMYVYIHTYYIHYIHTYIHTFILHTSYIIHEGRNEAMASRGQIFGGEIEVLKEYNLWLFLGL